MCKIKINVFATFCWYHLLRWINDLVFHIKKNINIEHTLFQFWIYILEWLCELWMCITTMCFVSVLVIVMVFDKNINYVIVLLSFCMKFNWNMYLFVVVLAWKLKLVPFINIFFFRCVFLIFWWSVFGWIFVCF